MGNTKPNRPWNPSLWASWKPFGIGEQRPNNYLEIWKALWESRRELPYAWRILDQGVCDGCALGTSGLKDWTLAGIHLCNIRLRLLRLNTMPALDTTILNDVSSLIPKRSNELRDLGRLPYPMIRRRDESGFRRISWEAALDCIAERIRATTPDRLGFYLTSRGMPNESYYAAQKAVRAMGTNAIDNAARVCHAPSTSALKAALNVAATTCSYDDWLKSDLIVFIGSNVANNQPVATKYLHYAKQAGAKVATINSYREPGMERYWVPSVPESALFGTKITDHFFMVNMGGDIAFLNGTIKHMIANGWVDWQFVQQHTTGFQELLTELATQSWDELERQSGTSHEEMLTFAQMLHNAKSAIFVWSMGVTQHTFGESAVQAIVNLALTKGFVGREGSGLMPIRGHSGVQGGAEMGAYATVFPGGQPINEATATHFGQLWGFDVPTIPGMTAPEMISAAYNHNLDVLFSSGGNFVEVLPNPAYVETALQRVTLRVHMDIVLSSQMLRDPADTVILLPATTRYEITGGVTETSTERRVIFSPEIPGPRIGEARAEWDVFGDLAQRVRPELADRVRFATTDAIRKEIGQIIPFYDGIQFLNQTGDQFQYGGPHLCADWHFPTDDGKAHFAVVPLPRLDLPEDAFLLSTRRGKQFNSIVHEHTDALNGAVREAVLISQEDADRLNLSNGEAVVLQNELNEFHGKVYIAPIKPGNLQVHWPEGNVLIDYQQRSPISDIPDYNALVRLEKRSEVEEVTV